MGLSRWYPGSGLTLGRLDARAAAVRANLGLAVDARSGLTMAKSSSGSTIRGVGGRPIVATVSGAGPAYTFTQALDSATGWAPGPRSGTAYEVNGVAGLAGTRQRLYPDRWGTWRFAAVRGGCAGGVLTLQLFYPCQRPCIPDTIDGPTPFAGQEVTVFAEGPVFGGPMVAIASGTTDASGKFAVGEVPCGYYCLVVSSPRYQTICLGTQQGGTYQYTMRVADGYVCAPWGCANPVDREMTLTILGYTFRLHYDYEPLQGQGRYSWHDGTTFPGVNCIVFAYPAPYCYWECFVTVGYTRYDLTSAGPSSCDPFSITFTDGGGTTAVMTEGW